MLPAPPGAQGRPGRDAKVTCKPGKARKGKVKVTCKVKLVSASGARAVRATLSRGSRVYARGSRRSAGPVTLRATRAIKPGRYTLLLRVTSRSGKKTVTSSTVVVRR